MALMLLVASEPMPLYPHINEYPVTNTCTSSAHYNVAIAALQNVVLQAIPIPFSSQSLSVLGCGRRVWRLKTTLREPIWEFTRVNEIAEHILILTHDVVSHGFNNSNRLGNSTRNELQSVPALLILRQKPIGNKVEVWHHKYLMTSQSITHEQDHYGTYSLWHHSGSSFSQARGKLEYDLWAQQQ